MARQRWSRRDFLNATASCGVVLASGGANAAPRLLASLVDNGGRLAELIRAAPLARYWVSTSSAQTRDHCLSCHTPADLPAELKHAHESLTVKCLLCANECLIEDSQRGRCRARVNVGGKLHSLVYGRPVSVHVDPIEKKPFYHFLPGQAAFSLATSGCALSCKFCQNWEISQARPEDFSPRYVSPNEVVQATLRRRAPIIAFTYNEPTVFTEYLTDIARAARKKQQRSVLVSCGFMTEAPLTEMCEVLDAIKIDLKGYSEDFYRTVCRAELQPVLRSIRQVAKSGIHLELVNLVVPTLNDSPKMLTELAQWVVGEIGPDVPIHFTRFHPDYQLTHLPPTPVATLERAREIAMKQGVHYAYVGNVPGHAGNHTYCASCGEVAIERRGFLISAQHVKDGRCESCNEKIPGVWK